MGQARTGGVAPIYLKEVNGRAEPCLTSGGEAAARSKVDFGGEAAVMEVSVRVMRGIVFEFNIVYWLR